MNISEARAIAEAHGLTPGVGEALYQKIIDLVTQKNDFWWDEASIAEAHYPGNRYYAIIDAIGEADCYKSFASGRRPVQTEILPREFWEELDAYAGDLGESYDHFLGKYAADCPVRHFGAIRKEIERGIYEAIDRGEAVEGLEEKLALCGTVAGLMGFPRTAGGDFFSGVLQERIHAWSDEVFILWSHSMRVRYGRDTLKLYQKVNELVFG